MAAPSSSGRRLRDVWDRTVHDVMRSRVGRALREAQGEPPQVVERVELQPEEEAVYESSPLETAFYGAPIHWRVPSARRELLRLRDVYVTGDEGAVFLSPRTAAAFQVAADDFKRRVPIPVLARRLEQPVLHLTGPRHHNRGHFLIEHLPRLVATQQVLGGTVPPVFLAPRHTIWQKKYLRRLGIAPEQTVRGGYGTFFCRELLYPQYLGTWRGPLLPARAVLGKMIAAFQSDLEPNDENEGDVLWISRFDAPKRQLVNEGELLKIAERHLGPTKLFILSGTSLEEQIEQVRRARLIIGAEGQAFHLGIVARGKTIITLNDGPRVDDFHWDHFESWHLHYPIVSNEAGNQALRLYSDKPRQEQDDWEYPAAKLDADLQRIATLL